MSVESPGEVTEQTVLLVEDNPGDVRLVREAFEAIASSVRLEVAERGSDALAGLRAEDDVDTIPIPGLILLDLDLPDIHGTEVLEQIKSDPALRRVPVVIFSSGDDLREVVRTYDQRANAYVQKPRDIDRYFLLIEQLYGFWFSAAKLPPVEDDHA